jgi:hypothetical protein
VSTEIYCSRFKMAQFAPIPKRALAEALNAVCDVDLNVSVPDQLPRSRFYSALGFSASELGVTGLVVERPSTDTQLYGALLSLLRLEGAVAYAPGSAPIIGHPATVKHLPPSLVASLGSPRLAGTSAELAAGLFGHEYR